jgi:hypothetical protein
MRFFWVYDCLLLKGWGNRGDDGLAGSTQRPLQREEPRAPGLHSRRVRVVWYRRQRLEAVRRGGLILNSTAPGGGWRRARVLEPDRPEPIRFWPRRTQ